MSKYQEFIEACKKEDDSSTYSKTKFVGLVTAMANDPDCAIDTYTRKGDKPEKKTVYPSRDLRNDMIAPIVKSFGVDKAEMARLEEVQVSRAGGEALANFALLAVKEYISKNGLGRKLTLPMTSETETTQTLGVEESAKETKATTMIVKDGDVYKTTPTGKIVTTEAHDKLKVTNKVPVWLKTTTEAKK